VTDFGLVRLAIDKHNGLADGTFKRGTGGYVAPELLSGKTTFEIVNGRRTIVNGIAKQLIHYGEEPYKVNS